MARKKSNGTPLKLFSGKEQRLNRLILQILRKKGALISYDIWLMVKQVKGFRHSAAKTVYRRIGGLETQGWILKEGKRRTKPGWTSDLYGISNKGKAALLLDERSIEEFLKTAPNEKVLRFIDSYS